MVFAVWLACSGDSTFTQHPQDTVVPDDTAGAPGSIALTPLELVWEADAVGGTLVRSFSIESVGEGPLVVTDIRLAGGAEVGFGVPTGGFDFPLRIKPGSSVPVSVTLTREVAGSAWGQVDVASEDIAAPTASVTLTAR